LKEKNTTVIQSRNIVSGDMSGGNIIKKPKNNE